MLGSYPLTITEENLHKDLETGDTQETDLSSPASFVGFSPPPSPIASLHQPPPTIPDPKGQQPEELRQIWSKVLTYYCQDKRIGEEVGSRTAVQLPKDVGALLLSVVEIKGTQSAIDFILSRDFSVASLDTQMESKIQLNLIRRDWRGHIKACGQGSALLQWNVPKFP
ncbi:hypothetical protein AOQ84DRAFT_355207 [Glonium stellatum]|uniref:Uncharacterized protein n=1 Tax=Glonium stellatum TaxID=574774 RepID=A0A8E2EYB7_9PEZI|nr:hypothetical protein AOQ84DRAFT_355207 [Glonium stellatum]